MKTLVSNPILIPKFTLYISNFPSLPPKPLTNPNFNFPKPLPAYNFTTLCSSSAGYGGWADLSSGGDSAESNQLRRLLNSFGVDEKKYAFVYLLGFVCALAFSRVRVSSIVAFPAGFLVFAVGFSFGVANRWDFNEVMSLFWSNSGKKSKKKRFKDDEFGVLIENMKNLGILLNGFDEKFVNLKSSMRKDVESNRISKSDLVDYIENVESIEQGLVQAKSMIKGFMDCVDVDTIDASKSLNHKSSDQVQTQKKRTEGKGFDISQFIAGFQERSFGSRASKVKDTAKNDSRYTMRNDQDQAKATEPLVEEKTMNFTISDDKSTYDDGDIRVQEIYGATFKQRRKKEYYEKEEHNYKEYNGNNMLYDDLESSENEDYENGSRFARSRSSEIDSDVLFNDYVTEANGLLKQTREWLRNRGIEEDAEKMLYKSTELLSKAVDMKPMSLLAVGQLGNTYLLHGELKLKLSRKLRALLAESDSNVFERLDDEVYSRDKFVDYLVNVCEECEELLVKAGRKYRMALSIDGDDMRALYNWGLALSFRAQLISDIGPEAAFDADKVYLAAIDKFNAMMSRSNAHTPDALFRWGVALQQRSRLRTRNFREKVKLLSQAKRLYEDALLMDSSNLQVKQALMTCESELRYRNRG